MKAAMARISMRTPVRQRHRHGHGCSWSSWRAVVDVTTIAAMRDFGGHCDILTRDASHGYELIKAIET